MKTIKDTERLLEFAKHLEHVLRGKDEQRSEFCVTKVGAYTMLADENARWMVLTADYEHNLALSIHQALSGSYEGTYDYATPIARAYEEFCAFDSIVFNPAGDDVESDIRNLRDMDLTVAEKATVCEWFSLEYGDVWGESCHTS